MLAVIYERKIYFPEFMVSNHNQGFKTSRDRYYRNFIFIAFNEVGLLPVVHNIYKSFRSPVMQNQNIILGLNIDPTGGVNLIKVNAYEKKDSEESTVDIASSPIIRAVDVPQNGGEWNVIAEYPAMHDYCAALLHLGVAPTDAISKTLAAMGHPNNGDISSISIPEAIKTLQKTYVSNKTIKEDSEGVLLDLIKGSIKSLK